MRFTLNILIAIACNYCYGQKSKDVFHLKGSIVTTEPMVIYVSYYSYISDIGVTDSCEVINGQFEFTGKINSPTIAFIRCDNSRVIDLKTVTVFLEPTEMEASLNREPFEVIRFDGSQTQLDYDSLMKRKSAITQHYKSVLEDLQIASELAKRDSLRKRLLPFYEEQQKEDLLFINRNPSSFISGYLLQSYYRLPIDTLKRFYSSMDEKLKNSLFGKQLATVLRQKSANTAGKLAVDFYTNDVKGKPLRLSDYRGKYVLLDFWASWCVPCRAGNPHLVNLYKVYKNKGLVIIGISSDEKSQEAWKRAIIKDKLKWVHVLRGAKSETDTSNLNYKFSVNSIPTKILIDKNGAIIGRWDGQTEQNDNDMDEVLKKAMFD